MEELYRAIEEKLRKAGYPGEINGEEIYDEICDEIEEKENGTYLFMAKREDGTIFEYKIDVLEDDFNLSYIHITDGECVFHADFDQ